jgi:glycosyltransferase involved in cell wall biosynthesis
MPKVTVLMPVYNGEQYLREAIDSILCQTFQDFEFLIIDDGSSDHSIDIINSYQDTRIALIKNEINLGLVLTLNKGLSLAKGEYIARMDADDISFCDRLENQIAFLDTNPDVSLLGTNAQIIDSEGNPQGFCNVISGYELIKWQMCFSSPFIHPSVIFRSQIIDKVNGYTSEAIKGREKYSGEDYDLWRRISKISQVDNLQKTLIYLRKHDGNLTKIYLKEHLRNASIINSLVIQEYIDLEPNQEVDQYIQKTSRVFLNQYQNTQEVRESILLIFKIRQQFTKKNDLPSLSKNLISKDAAKRISDLIYNYYRHDRSVLMLLLIVFNISPNVFWNELKIEITKTNLFLTKIYKIIKFYQK